MNFPLVRMASTVAGNALVVVAAFGCMRRSTICRCYWPIIRSVVGQYFAFAESLLHGADRVVVWRRTQIRYTHPFWAELHL